MGTWTLCIFCCFSLDVPFVSYTFPFVSSELLAIVSGFVQQFVHDWLYGIYDMYLGLLSECTENYCIPDTEVLVAGSIFRYLYSFSVHVGESSGDF